MKINNQIKSQQSSSVIQAGTRMKEMKNLEKKYPKGFYLPGSDNEKYNILEAEFKLLKQFQKEIKELKEFIEYNVRFERDADYHRLMDEIKNKFGENENK